MLADESKVGKDLSQFPAPLLLFFQCSFELISIDEPAGDKHFAEHLFFHISSGHCALPFPGRPAYFADQHCDRLYQKNNCAVKIILVSDNGFELSNYYHFGNYSGG